MLSVSTQIARQKGTKKFTELRVMKNIQNQKIRASNIRKARGKLKQHHFVMVLEKIVKESRNS